MVDVELQKYGKKLLANGFRVFQHEKGSSWLTFGKNGNVGYVEHDRFRGWSFSTVHKANRTTGTGFQVEREIPNATIDNAYNTFVFAPNWASEKDRDSIVKYNNIDDWAKQSYLSNTELKKPRFAYRVLKTTVIDGVRYGTPSIIHLKQSVAKKHLAKGDIEVYRKNKKILSRKKKPISVSSHSRNGKRVSTHRRNKPRRN